MDDYNIISLLWQRSEQAVPELERNFGSRLYTTAMNLLESPQDAEECVNDTYLAVWDAIPPNKPNALGAFVYRIGRNIALNRLRSNTAKKRNGYTLSLDELSGCISLPNHWDSHYLAQLLNAFLDTLSPKDRAIFLRRYWFGDSVQSIAATLHLTENAVSLRLHRTRDRLRTYLIKEGYYE